MVTIAPRVSCFTVLMILCSVALCGSQQASQVRPAANPIRVQTGEVVVDVSVTDGNGKPVRGLTQANFKVYEDGVNQHIEFYNVTSGDAGSIAGAAVLMVVVVAIAALVPAQRALRLSPTEALRLE